MESPEGWDLLISSLAVCDLQKPAAAWAFLALQGLVRNQPADRIAFFKIVEKVRTKSPSTNSSRARRIAGRLRAKRLALPAGDAPDPKGELALERRQLMDMWAKSFIQPEPKFSTGEFPPPADGCVREMFTLCQSCYNVYQIGTCHICPEPRIEVRGTPPASGDIFCSRCGAENRLYARFCRRCGDVFNDASPSPMCLQIFTESAASSMDEESDGCLSDVVNAIRDLWRASGELKKKA